MWSVKVVSMWLVRVRVRVGNMVSNVVSVWLVSQVIWAVSGR